MKYIKFFFISIPLSCIIYGMATLIRLIKKV